MLTTVFGKTGEIVVIKVGNLLKATIPVEINVYPLLGGQLSLGRLSNGIAAVGIDVVDILFNSNEDELLEFSITNGKNIQIHLYQQY